MSILTFFDGFILNLSLVISIGIQNIFVIKQGLKREYVGLTVFIVSLCDAILISLAVLGVGQFLADHPWCKLLLTLGGIVFLSVYGMKSMYNAYNQKNNPVDIADDRKTKISAKYVIMSAIGFSLINPQAMVDFLVIIGSVSAQYPWGLAMFLGAGAISASCLWFIVIAYGAQLFTPYFKDYRTWMGLDVFAGLVCFYIAGKLLLQVV